MPVDSLPSVLSLAQAYRPLSRPLLGHPLLCVSWTPLDTAPATLRGYRRPHPVPPILCHNPGKLLHWLPVQAVVQNRSSSPGRRRHTSAAIPTTRQTCVLLAFGALLKLPLTFAVPHRPD